MVQRKLAQIIPKEVKDPRLTGFVTVSAVKVTADLGHAKVYFTVLNEDKKLAESILNAAAQLFTQCFGAQHYSYALFHNFILFMTNQSNMANI